MKTPAKPPPTIKTSVSRLSAYGPSVRRRLPYSESLVRNFGLVISTLMPGVPFTSAMIGEFEIVFCDDLVSASLSVLSNRKTKAQVL